MLTLILWKLDESFTYTMFFALCCTQDFFIGITFANPYRMAQNGIILSLVTYREILGQKYYRIILG